MNIKSVVEWLLRLSMAAAIGMIYEWYWFDKGYLLTYLWLINYFRLQERDVAAAWTALNHRYTFLTSILVNYLEATMLAVLYKWYPLDKPNSIT